MTSGAGHSACLGLIRDLGPARRRGATLQVEAEHQEVNQLVRDLELELTPPERPPA